VSRADFYAGAGGLKARARSGHTSISLTRATRELLDQIRKHRRHKWPSDSFDDLLYRFAIERLQELEDEDRRDSIDSRRQESIDRSATLADSQKPR
jgi:hypothetical protein